MWLRLAQGILVGADRSDLGADVEVEHLQAVQHVLGSQPIHGVDDLAGRETELGLVAGGLDPLPRALRGQTRTHPDVRPDAELRCRLDHQVDLVEAVDHDDGSATQALGEQSRLDVGAVLVAVADDQGAGGVEQGQGDQQLRLAARLQAEAGLGAVGDDLLHHVALLVHLDGVDAPEVAPVLVLGDGAFEGLRDPLHPARQDVGEADQQRRAQAASAEVVRPARGGPRRARRVPRGRTSTVPFSLIVKKPRPQAGTL